MAKKDHSRRFFVLFCALVTAAFILPLFASADPGLGGIGNTQPPGGGGGTGGYVRQDPLPKELQDIKVEEYSAKQLSVKITFPKVFDFEVAHGVNNIEYRRYKAGRGFYIPYDVGEPEVLTRVFYVQVPQDAVKVKISSVQFVNKFESEDNVNLYPVPEKTFAQDPVTGMTGPKEIFHKNETLYTTSAWFPGADAKILSDSKMHGLRLVKVSVPVMKYNPVLAKIQEYASATLKISYQSKSNTNFINVNTQNNPFHPIFIDTVVNYNYAKNNCPPPQVAAPVMYLTSADLANPSWASQHDFYPDYLVIAAKEFHNSPKLNEWALHRANGGTQHRIAIAFTDDIYGVYNQELREEKIKAFISMAYNSWRVSSAEPTVAYLMLVGDADYFDPAIQNEPDWFLPIWRATVPSYAVETAGDADYVWMDGPDDLEDDMFFGRLPAQNEEQLGIFIDKIIAFDNGSPQGENHYGTRTLLLVGGNIEYIEDGATTRQILLSHKRELEEYHMDYLGFNGPDTFKFDSDRVTNFLNSPDGPGALFVNHIGHGSPLQGWNPPVFVENLQNADQLSFLVIASSCSTAHFDWALFSGEQWLPLDCYGERWTKGSANGAVCYFGATRPAWASALKNSQVFFDAVYDNGWNILGQCLAKVRLEDGSHSNKKIFVLLGDPAIKFDHYLAESTKPDLSLTSAGITPLAPASFDEEMTTSASFKNDSVQGLDNVGLKFFSVESGELVNFGGPWSLSMDPGEVHVQESSWNYGAESSRLILPWIDPDDEIDELCEFNNQNRPLINYYPIYAVAMGSGPQYGTKNEPFTNYQEAITHAFEADKIGPETFSNYSDGQAKAVKVRLGTGVYDGAGDTFFCPFSLDLAGQGASQTQLKDGLILGGRYNRISGMTFNGQGASGPALSLPVSAEGLKDYDAFIQNNIFKGWDDYAISIAQSGVPHQVYILIKNNVIYDNLGGIRAVGSLPSNLFNLPLWNNTITQNQNAFWLESSLPEQGFIYMSLTSSIIWENGPSVLLIPPPGTPIINNLRFIQYNDIDDQGLIDYILPNPAYGSGNINEDPLFMGLLNFQLNPLSPCIDTGFPWETDPDGTPSDMGAYGGADAQIRELRILAPVHGTGVSIPEELPVTVELPIVWTTPFLTEEETVHVDLSHMEKINGQWQKVMDLDVVVPNTGEYLASILQDEEKENYTLTVSAVGYPKATERIVFQVTAGSSKLYENR